MKRPSAASWLLLASALAICAAVELVGPLRSVRLLQCALDRARHGAERDLDGVVVRLPPSWWVSQRGAPRGTTDLRVLRVPRSRDAVRDALAIVRHVNFDLSREDAEQAMSTFAWETPQYGAWAPQELVDVELGGRPGYEIRYDRAGPPVGPASDVSSDYLVPAAHVWVQCAPMSADDLAQCRAIAESAAVATH